MRIHFIASPILFLCVSSAAQHTADVLEIKEPSVKPHIFITSPFHEPVSYSLPAEGDVAEHLNDKPLYAATVKNSRLHGQWQSWYQNGLLCDSGKLVNGIPDGVWKYWNEDGQLLALRMYDADKFRQIKNEIVRYHPKRVSFPLTELYHKNTAAAAKYFHASYSFPSNKFYTGSILLLQLVKANIANAGNYQPVFSQSLHHGLFMNYFANGSVKDSGEYKNGLRHGVWMHYDSNGAMQRGMYHHGKKIKEWKTYTAAGRLASIIFYNSAGEMRWRKNFATN